MSSSTSCLADCILQSFLAEAPTPGEDDDTTPPSTPPKLRLWCQLREIEVSLSFLKPQSDVFIYLFPLSFFVLLLSIYTFFSFEQNKDEIHCLIKNCSTINDFMWSQITLLQSFDLGGKVTNFVIYIYDYINFYEYERMIYQAKWYPLNIYRECIE